MDFDPQAIFRTLHEHAVESIVVGGIGGVLHGSPMSTDDVDIVPALKKANLDALAAALNEMNAKIMSRERPGGIPVRFTGKDLRRWIVDFGFLNLLTDHGRLDIIHRPGGTTGYQDLASNAESLELGDFEIRVAALEDIIRSKQAVARDRDLAQLPTLRALLEERRISLRVGDQVLVPWNLEERRGTIIEIRGVGPRAQTTVRVQLAEGEEEDLPLPLSLLKPTT